MKIHIVQKNINNKNLIPFLDKAKEKYSQLICFGELAISGCLYTPREIEPVDNLVKIFKQYDFGIMTGTPVKTEAGLRNSYLYYYRGKQQHYYKINLFPPMNENNVYIPGEKPGVFETELGQVGVAICYDIRYPELFDKLKQLKPKIIIIPAAFPRARINDWKNLLVERSLQAECMVIGINAVGDDGTNEFGGSSTVVNSDGKVLRQADEISECMLEVEV